PALAGDRHQRALRPRARRRRRGAESRRTPPLRAPAPARAATPPLRVHPLCRAATAPDRHAPDDRVATPVDLAPRPGPLPRLHVAGDPHAPPRLPLPLAYH